MKKHTLWLLILVLVLAAGTALAMPSFPDVTEEEMNRHLPRPQDTDWSYTVEGGKLIVTINDDREVDYVCFYGYEVDAEWGFISEEMIDEGNGKYSIGVDVPLDVDRSCVDIFFKNANGDNIAYQLNGEVSGYWASGEKDGRWVYRYWLPDGSGGAYSTMVSDDDGVSVNVDYDDAGKMVSFGIYFDSEDESAYALFDEDYQYSDAQIVIGDVGYVYHIDDETWHVYTEGAPLDQDKLNARLQDLIEKGTKLWNAKGGAAAAGEVKWYPSNSVCAVGLSLRDDLGLSDLWYNIVPIDLTQEGTQSLYLVAGNRHHVGMADVTVADGNVTVTYRLANGHIYLKSECLQWFTSLDQITGEFLQNPTSDLAFGEPVSIADYLGGEEVGLLFIRNTATYRQPYTNAGAELSRYWRNRDRWVDWRAELTELVNK